MPRPGHSADVIVVGAGSAGAAAARRLFDRGASVLLLEAGGPADNPAIHDVGRAHELWHAAEDWAFFTTPQAGAAGRELHWPRGRVVGGSSSLNAAIYVRGAAADFDQWAYLGCPGWRWDDVRPVYERMENPGPLHVLSQYELAPIHQSIIAAAAEAGIPFNENYNGGELDGISQMHLTIKDGRRQSTGVAYLEPIAGRDGFTLITGAQVQRLLLDNGRCHGIEWVSGRELHSAHAEREVIVAAGTIQSPQLLMLSGIGPAEHLRSVGVDPVVDLPGVGENLHDHLLSPVIFSAERPIDAPSPGATPAQTHLWWRSRPGLPVPDMQPIHFAFPMYEEWMSGPENGFTFQAGMIRPQSRGTIRLGGPTLADPLMIDPRILSAERDLDTLMTAVELSREIGRHAALRDDWRTTEQYPGPEVRTRDELRDYVRRTAITYHHQVGTCKMGTDEHAVVDERLRVYGVDGLRVADASIMPAVTSGNTNAPSIMIGERAGDFVAQSTEDSAQSTDAVRSH
jgi:choline dehydrogenase-like flavoprotein